MIDDEFHTWYYYFSWDAGVAELADAPDLGSGAARRAGSNPAFRTKQRSIILTRSKPVFVKIGFGLFFISKTL